MSKRTQGLTRRAHDSYDTPAHAVSELLKHLLPITAFIEPCAGSGQLRDFLVEKGHWCTQSTDIFPRGKRIGTADAATEQYPRSIASCFITNPPWTRELLHPIIENLSNQLPTWLLFDSDWAVNAKTPKHLLDRCERIVAQGRVRWMLGQPGDKGHSSVDNVSWYRFDATHTGGPRWFNRR